METWRKWALKVFNCPVTSCLISSRAGLVDRPQLATGLSSTTIIRTLMPCQVAGGLRDSAVQNLKLCSPTSTFDPQFWGNFSRSSYSDYLDIPFSPAIHSHLSIRVKGLVLGTAVLF